MGLEDELLPSSLVGMMDGDVPDPFDLSNISYLKSFHEIPTHTIVPVYYARRCFLFCKGKRGFVGVWNARIYRHVKKKTPRIRRLLLVVSDRKR